MHIPSTLPNGKPTIIILEREAYIVDKLEVNLLLRIDTIVPEKIRMDFSLATLTISSYKNVVVPIAIRARGLKIELRVKL